MTSVQALLGLSKPPVAIGFLDSPPEGVAAWNGGAVPAGCYFWKKAQERKYTATFIDQGYCFNAGEWNFPDSSLRGVYARNFVYQEVRGWESFEPWLGRVENLDPSIIDEIAGAIPPEWTGNDWGPLEKLVQSIVERRGKVRELIFAFRNSSRQPFPAWSVAAPKSAAANKSGVQ